MLIKQIFIGLLSFSRSLATRCFSLNNESCMIRPTLIDLNFTELNYHPFMTSLDKCNGSLQCSTNLPKKIYVLRETKDINS